MYLFRAPPRRRISGKPCASSGVAVEWIARRVEADIFGQGDGQVGARHRNGAAIGAMDHRDRATPVALARNAPIAQPEVHLPRAAPLLDKLRDDLLARRGGAQPVKIARIEHDAIARIGCVGDVKCRIRIRRTHDRAHGQVIFPGKIQIALIVRRTRENRAGAIAHQNKICHIDRQQPVRVKRVAYEKPGVIAQLLAPLNVALAGSARRAHGPEIGQFRVGCRQFKRQWVVGRKRTKAGAIQRVWSGRVNLDIAKFPDRLSKFKPAGQPFRPTDPIGLHEAHFFRPARQPVQRTQQIIGKIRDFQKPLGQRALLDAAPDRQPLPSITCSFARTV